MKTGMISITIPKPGRAMMYTSGWPKNQKRFCHRKLLPPCSFTKKAVWAVRSRIPKSPATTSVGVASVRRAHGRQDAPGEDRQPTPGHAGRSVVDDGAGQVEAGQDHADPDDREADQVGVHPARRLRLQGGVAGPPGREPAEEERAQDDQVARHEDPEGEGLDARVGHAP